MSIRSNVYLQRQGDAREQMSTYHQIFGGELTLTAFADMAEQMAQVGMQIPEADQQKVMHAELKVSESMSLMSGDLPTGMPATEQNVHVSIDGDDPQKLRGWFEALAEGGSIDVPLEQAPWGDHFGQVKDRYGVNWMFNIAG